MAKALPTVFLVLLVALYFARRRRSRHLGNVSLPPGPKGLPLLGAALSIDASKPWFTYFQWRKSFGECHLQLHLVSLIHSRRSRLHTHLQHECTRHKLR